MRSRRLEQGTVPTHIAGQTKPDAHSQENSEQHGSGGDYSSGMPGMSSRRRLLGNCSHSHRCCPGICTEGEWKRRFWLCWESRGAEGLLVRHRPCLRRLETTVP